MAEHGNGQPAKKWNHYAEIVRPEMLGQWAMDKNTSLAIPTRSHAGLGRAAGQPEPTAGVYDLPA